MTSNYYFSLEVKHIEDGSYRYCCSVFFSKLYEKNPLNIVDDKQSQQYKWFLNIVDLQQLIESKPAKVLIYAIIIVKQQKERVITPIIQWKPDIQRIVFIITPVKKTNTCYQSPFMGWVLGYSQTPSVCVESLSSIMCKPNKNMVCNNENNQSYNNGCSNENNQKWIMDGKPFYL